ncbi:mitochondrial large ribosomal subunit L49 [Blastomyces gilchristii SLH14081]|uniref:Large ribosomal subunit protein mL49 n=1 Tax=Blastomyces gilchristii (strain SLH14081) TaxID=559298 RepID=A0A179UR32_BLAGS|nr:mitochondrial large ribosomal subunit L49 [Blastomyces gilchristii SLH14081]OAT10464.1 mitochondrial large ribosomal subunit L49 [Blastomyces gilchristii SLH14081]
MAALLPSSSISPVLRQKSSMLSLCLRSNSSCLSNKRSLSSLSQSLSRTRTFRSQPPKRSFSSLATQTRHITTRIPRPFSQSKSTKATKSATSTQPAPVHPPLPLTNLPYFIRRTPSNQLPVYLVTKAGGTKQETKIQKTEGDVDALCSDLAKTLGIEPNSKDIYINRLNGHVVVKGWRKPEIQQFLLDRKF